MQVMSITVQIPDEIAKLLNESTGEVVAVSFVRNGVEIVNFKNTLFKDRNTEGGFLIRTLNQRMPWKQFRAADISAMRRPVGRGHWTLYFREW